MPIDVDLSHWNKENIWDVAAHLIPTLPEAEMAEGNFEEEENNSENMAHEEVDSEDNLRNGKMSWNSRKRKRMAAEEEKKSLISEQVELVSLRRWWPNKEEKQPKGNDFAFENIFKPSKVMPATFLSSPKPTMKAEQQSRKHRVVLGELTDFILSPLRKQRADESPSPAKTIGENNGNGGGMGRSSRQNGITV